MFRRARSYGLLSLRVSIWSVLVASLVALPTASVQSGDFSEQQELVDKAKLTIKRFAVDPQMEWFRNHSKEAKALFIVPQLLRGAFIFGGAGGSGVLVARDERTGKWTQPAFYTMGSASFGLQIGGDAQELVFVIRSTRGLESFYTSSFELGGDISIAAGPVGGGVGGGITEDIVSFFRSKGAYGGVSLEGAWVSISSSANEAYYGKPVRPVDILVARNVSNPKSLELRAAVEKAVK